MKCRLIQHTDPGIFQRDLQNLLDFVPGGAQIQFSTAYAISGSVMYSALVTWRQ